MAKYDYNTLNPQTIGDLSPREMRAAYSELRSIARKRADRLEAAGYEARRFDQLSKVFSADLEEELAELAYWLRSPGSRVSSARKEKEQASIAAHGYSIADFSEFGRFMDDITYRFKNRKLHDSGSYADIYQALERRHIPISAIQAEFSDFLDSEEEAKRLLQAIESTPVQAGVTIEDINEILNPPKTTNKAKRNKSKQINRGILNDL